MITITPLMYVPIFKADAGFPPSLPLTSRIPMTRRDDADRRNNQRERVAASDLMRTAAVSGAEFTATAASVTAEIMEPT